MKSHNLLVSHDKNNKREIRKEKRIKENQLMLNDLNLSLSFMYNTAIS